MKKTISLLVLVVLLSGCASFMREASYKWEKQAEWNAQNTRYSYGSFYSGIPPLSGWDLEAFVTEKTSSLGSAVLVAGLQSDRPKQWRNINRLYTELCEVQQKYFSHPNPDEKTARWGRYIFEILAASEMAAEALRYNDRDTLEESKDKVQAARAVFYRIRVSQY